jgi:hypothetical protein
MKIYIYQSAMLCGPCGERTRLDLANDGEAPEDPDDEVTYDSCGFPKGPYLSSDGAADTPDHCDSCGLFLEYGLTTEGEEYVKDAALEGDIPQEWRDHYAYLWN